MKKKMQTIFVIGTIACVSLTGCTNSTMSQEAAAPVTSSSPETNAEETAPSQVSEEDSSTSSIEKSFGSYSIAEDWLESQEFSSDDTFFYLKEGTPLDSPTSNISVSMGTNKYSVEDYQSFAQAIDRQLKMQVASNATEYYGSGAFTEKGYPLITMTIETDNNIRTIQHYIVGDFCYVMVHATDFGDEKIPDVEEVALAIANSFVWNE